jgi:DNA primase
MNIIDEVKQRADIVEVISQYTTLAKAGRTLKGLCPFHNEKHASFFVYPEQQSWHCFGACNSGGDVFTFIMKKESIDFGEALRLLAQRAGVIIPSRTAQETDKDKNERLYQANEAAAQYFHNLLVSSKAGKRARDYIARRGFEAKTITDFQLGYSLNSWDALKQYLIERDYSEAEQTQAGLTVATESGDSHDRFRHRLMFPIFDAKRRIVGFGARALDDSLPKYINSPETPLFNKSGILYGINLAREAIKRQKMAVIVEGYIDAITAHQNSFNNVVASMGTSVTEKQILTIKRLTRNLVFALDADAAGREATLRGVNYENTIGDEVKVVILPKGKDPDDVIKKDTKTWQYLLDEALPIVDYTFNWVASELDLTTDRGRTSALDALLPILAAIKNDIRLDHYVKKLAQLCGVSYRTIESSLKAYLVRSKIKTPMIQKSFTPAPRMLLANSLEEYCLMLLLQHPELKVHQSELSPDYFLASENREILIALMETDDPSSLKDRLDSTIWEYLDNLMKRSLPADQIEKKLTSCILRLREKYLRNLEMKKGAILAGEAESGGTLAELAKLEEQGLEISTQLKEVFSQKSRGGKEQRR